MFLLSFLKKLLAVTLLSVGIALAAVPTITSFSPLYGPVGSSVTITGTNFSATPTNNTVYIGGVKANVTSASTTSLTITVPLGATHGLISVTTGGLVAHSRILFTPSFTSDNSMTTSSFPTGTSITFPKISNGVARGNSIAVDFDGDGKPDLAHLSPYNNVVSVHRNIHTGGALLATSFDSRQDFSAGSSSGDLYDIDYGDVDGDGKLDIVVVCYSSNTVSVLRNTSTVGSISFAAKVDFSTLNYSKGISLGDVDGDGKLDIAVAGNYKFSLFRNTSTSGSISFATRVDYSPQDNPNDIKLVDLDGDGLCDIAMTCGGSTMADQVLSVFRSTSTAGTFSLATEQQTLLDYYMTDLEFTDFDLDGKPDMYASKYDYNVYVLPNTSTSGSISFGTTITLAGYYTPTMTVADVTGDGKPEAIVAVGSGSGYFKIYKNTSSPGSLSFASGTEFVYQEGGSYYPMSSIVAADFNLDGKIDLAGVASSSSNGIGLFENKVTSPQFRASSYNYSMGTFPVGKYVKDSINVTNNGGQSLTISSVANSNTSDFSVSPTSATIANGSNQYFVITYHYTGTGTRTTKLTFTHTAANLTDTVSVSATSSYSAQANAGKMIQFDGTDDYVNIPDATQPTAYTIEAWVKFNSISAQNIFVRTDAGGPSGSFSHQLLLTSAGKFAHYTYFGTSNTVLGTTTVVAGQWYHVAITAQNSGMMRLFVNGVEEGTAQSVSGTLWAGGDRWNIGNAASGPYGNVGYFNGTLDEVRMWNTTRTASQIQSSYASQAGNESNLSRYFRFDEGAGTSSGDGVGNTITATLVNGTTWASSTAPLGTPTYSISSSSIAFGYIANGSSKMDSVTISNTGNGVLNITPSSNNVKLTFSPSTLAVPSGQNAKLYITFSPQAGSDSSGTITLTHNATGSPNTISANHLTSASFSKAATAGNMLTFNYDQYSDYASTPYSATVNPSGSFTYEVWARSDAYSGYGYVISSGDYYSGVQIYRDNSAWNAQIGTGGSPIYLTSSGVTNGVWYHLVVTYSGSTAKFYVNGVLKDTKTGTYNRNTTYPFIVGSSSTSPWYSGLTGAVDEVRVWNTARTQEQIYSDMTNSLYGNELGLIGYWRFDEGSGTTVQNITQNGNNLTLGGTNYTPSWQSSTANVVAPWYNNYTSALSYGTLQISKTKKDSFYVKNFGGANLSISSVSSDNAVYSISPTSATITPNDSGKFIVTFAPTAVQAENGTITVTHNASGSPNSVTVSGTGATATYSANVSSLSFGNVQVGVSILDSVTISNTGGIALSIDSVKSSNSNYTISPTSATVAASGSQKFYVTFSSALPTGAANGTISFYHSSTGSPGTVSVSGTKVQQAAASAGTTLYFDGSNDVLTRSVFSTATNNISFEAWVKWSGQTVSGNRFILYNGNTSSSGFGLFIDGSNNNGLSILCGGVGYAKSSYILTANEWQHVAVVRESGTWKLYVDGVQQSLTNSTTTPNTPSGTFYIGANVGGSEAFKGRIDEVRFWSTARTQTQIQASYNSLTGTESGLAAYYRFDENSGSTAYDNSGNGRNLTLTNGPTYFTSSAYIGTPTYSNSVSSISFGSVQPGLTKTDSMTISNTGGGLLNVGTITSGDGSYTFSPSNVAVRPSASQKFYVTFQPMAPAASHSASLSVPHNASGSPSSVSLTGSGAYQAAVSAGNGMSFNATSKFIDIASNSLLSTANYTVELWMKIGATWTWNAVIDKGRNTGNNWYILTSNSASSQPQGIITGMQGATEVYYQWGDANWHHVAMTYDGSNYKVYVDGNVISSQAVSGYTPVNAITRIGGRQDTSVQSLNPFNGNIDEVRLWNVARTQAQIQSSYASLTGNETGLVSYLRFDESSGTTAYDATGNGLSGTLINNPSRQISSTAPVGVPLFSSALSKNFGNLYLSQSTQDSITISNTGNGILNISSISSNNSQFVVTPSTLNISGGSSGKIYITATPTSLGTQTGTISLTHNASGSPSTISVQANGIVPSIASFNPTSGAAGTSVVISGSGFSSTPANNIVYFGATKGTVSASTDTTITVTVPTGGTSDLISVTTNNLTAYSKIGFIISFTTSNEMTSGSFAANTTATGASNGYGMTIGDLDGDGKPDLVTGNQNSNGLNALRNTSSSGSFSFASIQNFATGSSGLDVALGDLDGDGKLDGVVTLNAANKFSLFRNTSTSGNISFATRIDSTCTGAHGAVIGDLDGDGKPEVIVTKNSSNAVAIYKNSSSPGSISITTVLTLSSNSGPREVHLADFDGDGKLDIAVGYYGSTVSVFRNTSSLGSISFSTKQDVSLSSSSFGFALGDLTGDGKPEIISASGTNTDVFQNTSSSGSISFNARVSFSAQANRTVTLADFSGDGKLDIATNNSSSSASVLKNIYTSGTLNSSSFAAKVDFAIGASAWNLRSADFDGDGRADLASISESSTGISLLRNTVPLPATFSSNPTALSYGSISLGTPKVDSVYVHNTGGVSLSVTTVASTNAQFAVSPLSATVAVGDSQKFTITYTPSSIGAISGNIVFTDNTIAGSDTVNVSGTGLSSQFSLSNSSKSFGDVLVSASKIESVYVKNTGNATLTVSAVTSSDANFVPSPTSFSINASDSAKLFVTFTPSSTGSKNSVIEFTHNGQTTPDTLLVDGTGIHPIFSSDKASVAFSSVGIFQTKTDSVTITNTGSDVLEISSVTKSSGVYSVTPTSASLSASTSQKFYITYIPTSTTTTNDTVIFTHNAGSVSKIPLSGTGALLAASSAGNAIDLNGSNQYVDVSDGVWFNGNFTVESWVYVRSVGNYARLIDFANGPSSDNIIIPISTGTGGNVSFHIFQGGTSSNITDPNPLPLNTWVHIACVYNSGTGKIYINGVETASGTLLAPSNVTRTLNYIGKSQWADAYANMKVDEFRIWNVARTQTQIRSAMNTSLTGGESGLLAYFRFDETGGTTANNVTGNGSNATLFNSPLYGSSNVKIPGSNFIPNKTSFAFGLAEVGNSARDTVWIKNYGTVNLQIDSVKSSNSEFTLSPTNATVATNDSARFVATLTPLTTGTKTATITFYSNAFSSPNSFSAGGTAISSEPTVRDSNAVFVNPFAYRATVKWKKGDADNHLVILKSGSAVDGLPVDGSSYTANSIFSSGSQLGTENYVVYSGADDSVVVTNLTAGQTYYVSVVGFNGSSSTTNYLTPSAALNSFTVPYPVNSPMPGFVLNFDGTNNRNITIPFSTPSTYTIEMWVKPHTTSNQTIFCRTDASGPLSAYSHSLDINSGTFRHYLFDGSGKSVSSPTAIVADQWYHVALVAANSGMMRLYVDGREVGTAQSTGILWTGGDRYVIGYGSQGIFNGSIDEVRIWNTVRTAQQIRENMHNRLTGNQSGLLAYFQFNEGSGATVIDSIKGNTGTVNNSPVWQTSTVPFGSGTSASVSAAQSGSQTIGSMSLNLSDAFDSPVDVTTTEIATAPNVYPASYSSFVGNKYFVINLSGDPGTFATSLTINFGAGVLDSRADAFAGGVKLFTRSTTSDGAWTEIGGAASANSTTGDVTWNNISSFSQFAAVYDESALPVELVSFTALTKRLNAELKWKTATETNNHGFEIERKLNNQDDWKRLGFVEGSGTSNAPKEYSFKDKNSIAGKYLYRLKQIDRDGKFHYSQTIEVEVGSVPKVFVLEQNYPNPFNPTTTIGFTLEKTGMTTLKIYDAIGREVATLVNEVLDAGVYHQKQFDASHLASGIYFARLVSDGKVQIKKLMLMK